MQRTIHIRKPFDGDESSTVLRAFILVHKPGCTPDKKIPPQTNDGISEFLLELELCRPKWTTYTVVQLVWDGDIWVTSGREWLAEHRAANPRKFAALKRKVKSASIAADTVKV